VDSAEMSRFLNYQKKIVDGDHDENNSGSFHSGSDNESELDEGESSSYGEEAPDHFDEDERDHNKTMQVQGKISVPKLNMTMKVENMNNLNSNAMGTHKMAMIPKLELSKAKEIQDLIVKKINNDEKKKAGTVKEEKYKKLENELIVLRKKLGKVLI
jgi:hypothetical protein